MAKLRDRVLRLEYRLEDKDQIASMQQKMWILEKKLEELARCLHLTFKEGLSVESTKDG